MASRRPRLARLPRVRRAWHVDLTDDRDLDRLRGRIVALAGGVGLAFTLAAAPFEVAAGGRAALVAVGATVLFAAGVLALGVRYGSRLGERTFTALILAGVVLSAQTTATRPFSSPSRIALAVMTPLLIGAVFSRSRAAVAVQAGCAMAVVVGFQVSDPAPGGVTDVPLAIFILGAVTMTIHRLWRLALAALRQARRNELTDPLTGVANRRGLEREGCRHRPPSPDETVALIVVDVDHFKKVNDTLGHAAGDDLLRRLAALLSDAVREGDVVARLGGEEFAVLCTLAPGQAPLLAERIRGLVEERLAPVTVSVGVHEPDQPPDGVPGLWAALDRADGALYRAKRTGRNRVEVAVR